MTILLRCILIIVSLLTTVYIIKKIRQAKVQIEDSIFWILFALILIVISIFPQIPRFFAALLGIYSTENFLFLFMIFVLLIKIFYMTIRISQLDHKVQELSEKIAIDENLRYTQEQSRDNSQGEKL